MIIKTLFLVTLTGILMIQLLLRMASGAVEPISGNTNNLAKLFLPFIFKNHLKQIKESSLKKFHARLQMVNAQNLDYVMDQPL